MVGVGGLGCPAATSLARAGVRRITLADPDRVELHNLHRQPLHRTGDVGRLKVESGRERLLERYPGLAVEARPVPVSPANATAWFREHQLVIDATDDPATKLLLSDVAVATGVPLVYAGAVRAHGQVMAVLPGGPCLRCLFEDPPAEGATCAQAGVWGAAVGVVGARQGLEGASVLRGSAIPGSLWRFDADRLLSREIAVHRAPDCPACSEQGRACG